jgi:hypothetical protein
MRDGMCALRERDGGARNAQWGGVSAYCALSICLLREIGGAGTTDSEKASVFAKQRPHISGDPFTNAYSTPQEHFRMLGKVVMFRLHFKVRAWVFRCRGPQYPSANGVRASVASPE